MKFKQTDFSVAANFLASADYLAFTAMGLQNDGVDSVNPPGLKLIAAGTVHKVGGVAKGLYLEEVNVTDGDQPASVMIRGYVYENRLPAAVTAVDKYVLQEQGILFCDDNRMPVVIAKPDVVVPTFAVTPAVDVATAGSMVVTAQLSEAGKIYVLVIAKDATAPTAAQVKAGVAYGDPQVAVVSKYKGSDVLDKSLAMAAAAYDVYFVGEDAAGNLMAAPVKVANKTVS